VVVVVLGWCWAGVWLAEGKMIAKKIFVFEGSTRTTLDEGTREFDVGDVLVWLLNA
jgi:hypothetical protein